MKEISAIIIGNDDFLDLEQFQHTFHINTEIIFQMVEHQIIQPIGKSPKKWRFDSECIRRTKIALELYQDFEINFAGLFLALELLDKIKHLEKQIQLLGNNSPDH